VNDARASGVTTTRRAGTPGPAVGPRAGGQPRGDAPDIVSIYAERLRASAAAPPLFAPRPVVRIGRGTPAFRRHRPAMRAGSRSIASPPRLTRRGRLVAVAATVAAVVTTALAGTVLAG